MGVRISAEFDRAVIFVLFRVYFCLYGDLITCGTLNSASTDGIAYPTVLPAKNFAHFSVNGTSVILQEIIPYRLMLKVTVTINQVYCKGLSLRCSMENIFDDTLPPHRTQLLLINTTQNVMSKNPKYYCSLPRHPILKLEHNVNVSIIDAEDDVLFQFVEKDIPLCIGMIPQQCKPYDILGIFTRRTDPHKCTCSCNTILFDPPHCTVMSVRGFLVVSVLIL